MTSNSTMEFDEGGGFVEADLKGRTTVEIDSQLSPDGVHLSIETVSNGRISLGVTLNEHQARILGEQLLAHAVLLDTK